MRMHTVENTSFGMGHVTLTSAGFIVEYQDASGFHSVTNVQVVDDGGWVAGLVLTDGQTTDYAPHIP